MGTRSDFRAKCLGSFRSHFHEFSDKCIGGEQDTQAEADVRTRYDTCRWCCHGSVEVVRVEEGRGWRGRAPAQCLVSSRRDTTVTPSPLRIHLYTPIPYPYYGLRVTMEYQPGAPLGPPAPPPPLPQNAQPADHYQFWRQHVYINGQCCFCAKHTHTHIIYLFSVLSNLPTLDSIDRIFFLSARQIRTRWRVHARARFVLVNFYSECNIVFVCVCVCVKFTQSRSRR